MSQKLNSHEAAFIGAVQTHPLHQQGLRDIIRFVYDLRRCDTDADLYDFQQQLLEAVLRVQEHRQACGRVVKRLEKGRTVPGDAELRGPGDPLDIEAWRLEQYVCERVSRQLRSVGDALAWRVFGFQRNFILVLSRNEPPGDMAGKAGLAAERAYLTDAWRDGRFTLLHDLTNCLRIGDVTVFDRDHIVIDEIKTNPRRRSTAQQQRIVEAAESLRSSTPMPTGMVPVALDLPYKTHLAYVREILDLAHQRGVHSDKLPGGRAITAANILGGPLADTDELASARFVAAFDSVRRRARIAPPHQIILDSVDRVGRSAVTPPWAIYPLAPEMCASLIVDAAIFYVAMDAQRILSALVGVGLEAEWAQSLDDPIDISTDLLRVLSIGPPINGGRMARRGGIMFSELNRLLLEFVDLDVWAQHVAMIMERSDLDGVRPWPYFAQEADVWV